MDKLTNQNIGHFVVHIMDKEARQPAVLIPAPGEKPVHAAITRLVNDVLDRYKSRGGKGYGKFENDEDNFPMGKIIKDYSVLYSHDFYQTSLRMLNHLEARAIDAPLSTGGKVVIVHINRVDQEDLLVAILISSTGSTIKNHDIEDSEYLDISKLRVAGKIDLTAMKAGKDNYISFLKGQNDVAGYFKKFLGCNDVVIAKKETQKLKHALESFADNKNLNTEKREDFLNKSYEKLKELNDNQQPFEVSTFSNSMWPQAPDELQEVLVSDVYELSEGFVPDGNVIKEMITFKGKGKHWFLKFDRDALKDGSIEFDDQDKTIMISNLPDSLIAQLKKELGLEEDVNENE
ncbi:nucleoid-associated protein [Pantoea sp. Acro-807]|uniref:nucleoid-associated protein n=1 Tax=Pantoea TaxID=53335 RepID=UPI0014199442|nr:nucleoid-associated protein [Pantoea sp. Acro-807]NIE70925.1 nucleoid-associated protein [Pantoea sp. Acro-807]